MVSLRFCQHEVSGCTAILKMKFISPLGRASAGRPNTQSVVQTNEPKSRVFQNGLIESI